MGSSQFAIPSSLRRTCSTLPQRWPTHALEESRGKVMAGLFDVAYNPALWCVHIGRVEFPSQAFRRRNEGSLVLLNLLKSTIPNSFLINDFCCHLSFIQNSHTPPSLNLPSLHFHPSASLCVCHPWGGPGKPGEQNQIQRLQLTCSQELADSKQLPHLRLVVLGLHTLS